MSGLLILTVGTGTAGSESNLAQGLVNTIGLVAPRGYWLVPSSHPDSLAVAGLVQSEAMGMIPWSETEPFRSIPDPDDLGQSRSILEEVLARARTVALPGESIIVNPVSGTKQMTAAGTLAAVDARVDRVVFTVGQRRDGVVRTGTETLVHFDIARHLASKDLALAQGYFTEGAFDAAFRLLNGHTAAFPVLEHSRDLCRLMHLWQRGDWKKACGLSKRMNFSEKAGALRRHLEQLAIEPTDSVTRKETLWAQFCEFIAACDASLAWDEPEDALGRLYRAAEHLGKTLLYLKYDLLAPYARDSLTRVFPGYRPFGDGNLVALGLREVWRILGAGDSTAPNLLDNPKLWDILQHRNQTWIGHGHEMADRECVIQGRMALMDLARHFRQDIAHHPAFSVRPTAQALSLEGF